MCFSDQSSTQASDKLRLEAIAYEFVAQAFLVYEEQIADSRAQFNAITLIAATLAQMRSLGKFLWS